MSQEINNIFQLSTGKPVNSTFIELFQPRTSLGIIEKRRKRNGGRLFGRTSCPITTSFVPDECVPGASHLRSRR